MSDTIKKNNTTLDETYRWDDTLKPDRPAQK